MKVYQSKVVKQYREWYGKALFAYSNTTLQYLEAIKRQMQKGIEEKAQVVFQQFSNYHPSYLGKSALYFTGIELNEMACKKCLAQEYGFDSWLGMRKEEQAMDQVFETTVDCMLSGNLEALKERIKSFPDLVHQRSQWGHGATLLHYCGSNGVELWRQQVPESLTAILSFLIESGSTTNATMKVYGGAYTTAQLLGSSAHPKAAGVMEEALNVLATSK